MSEIIVIIIFIAVLFDGVMAYSFFSTSLGYEESEK